MPGLTNASALIHERLEVVAVSTMDGRELLAGKAKEAWKAASHGLYRYHKELRHAFPGELLVLVAWAGFPFGPLAFR